MFRQLDYQDRALDTLGIYLDLLKTNKLESDAADLHAKQKPHLNLAVPDFTKVTWNMIDAQGRLPASRSNIPFSERKDDCGQPVPNIVLKVPTGGGKTWLAVSAVSRIMGRYLERNFGFVLWIVPNEAIYSQTLKQLKDRQHPYRQALDLAAAGRVRILEKKDPLHAREVESNLCVMLLMLQSSNRESQESLKMFRDRGDIHGFFPAEDEQQAHLAALNKTPNLSTYEGIFPMVKDSLGNALRVIRPVVVLDEGHRAISDLAFRTLYGFNPCFVLELTATPQDVQPKGGKTPKPGRYANILVEVTGNELDREGMIKMPLNLDTRQGSDWKTALNAAIAKIEELDVTAQNFRSESNRYIRPIMLVQVERTGADQRDNDHIHAEDVKEWLLTAGFDEAEIAIKTAQQNDLNDPENQDLLSPTNRVRAIITKQALQEGWDCPFAYVLCSLAANANLKAMTQLVGRILRQPHALKTEIQALDECYVVTHRAKTADAVKAIKNGLEGHGLGDLVRHITQGEGEVGGNAPQKIGRRPAFASTEIYLPKVMYVDGDTVRELDYETDVLSAIDWRGFEPGGMVERIPENPQTATSQLQRIRITDDGDDKFVGETISGKSESLAFDLVHAVRMVSDIVLNPFVGYEIVERVIDGLRKRGFDDAQLGTSANLIVEELRKELDEARDLRAEKIFRTAVASGRFRFRLRLDGRNWRMPFSVETAEPVNARQLNNYQGEALQKSLFSPVYEADMNADEKEVAIFLDGEQALTWWHRNVARAQYGIQGWRKAKIYPDFIFSVQREEEPQSITVLETKGDQLDNFDTAYKRDLLTFLSDNFSWDEFVPAGELELVMNNGETVRGVLVLMSEWKTK